jgi:hypothetical protein
MKNLVTKTPFSMKIKKRYKNKIRKRKKSHLYYAKKEKREIYLL